MKKIIIIFAFVFLNSCNFYGKKTAINFAEKNTITKEVKVESTLKGLWFIGSKSNALTFNGDGIGEYISPLGTFSARGVTTTYDEKANAFAVAIALSGKNGTASMSGQIYLDNNENKHMEVFFTYNVLTTNPYFNKNYGETLRFLKSSVDVPISTKFDAVSSSIPLSASTSTKVGVWINKDTGSVNNSDLNIIAIDEKTGLVMASYYWKNNNETVAVDLFGYIPSESSSSQNSLSLIGKAKDNSFALAITGSFNTISSSSAPSKDYLNVIINISTATGEKVTYGSTKSTGALFVNTGTHYKEIREALTMIDLTDNGAANAVSNLNYGTPSQALKVAFDTGGEFNWVNSTQCTANPCVNYGHHQYNQAKSSSFSWVDKVPRERGWGPWGTSMANSGTDIVQFGGDNIRTDLGLITNFEDTAQFQEFLWDGAMPIPSFSSGGSYGPISNIVMDFVKKGTIDPSKIQVTFDYPSDGESNAGNFIIGGWDSDKVDLNSKLILKQKDFAIPYLWTTPLFGVKVGDQFISIDRTVTLFALDTGASSLKGDTEKMKEVIDIVTKNNFPNLTYYMGEDINGKVGELVLVKDNYYRLIEQGEYKGTKRLQIQPLDGLKNLWLQGTTLLQLIYTVYNYELVISPLGELYLQSNGMWIFNKKGGQKVIQTK